MKLHQISVFLENKPGQLKFACQQLVDANINILALSLADSKQYGILRLITPEWERAQSVFKQARLTTNIAEVLAVEVADRPGGLLDILDVIETVGLNVEYMYAFTFGKDDKAVLIFRFDDPDAAMEKLRESGNNIIGSVELFDHPKK